MLIKTLIATTALSLALAAPAVSFAADATPAATMSNSATIKGDKLLKADVRNGKGDKVGDVESVLLDKAGKSEALIVDVGGFLGMGEHRVALNWNDVSVTDNGKTVTTQYTKDQLKAMPEYKYPDEKHRSTAFYDPNWYATPAGTSTASSTHYTDKTTDRTASADWARLSGEFKASKLIDADVRSTANDDKVGDVKDIIIDQTGKVRSLIVDVGGFLGAGSRQVALDMSKFTMMHKGDDLRLSTALTKDQLKSMPEFNGTLASNETTMTRTSGGGMTSTTTTTKKK